MSELSRTPDIEREYVDPGFPEPSTDHQFDHPCFDEPLVTVFDVFPAGWWHLSWAERHAAVDRARMRQRRRIRRRARRAKRANEALDA